MSDHTSTSDKRADRLENLKVKKAALEAQIAALNAATAKEKRRLDTRKKILVGAVVLEEAARDPQIAAWLQQQLAHGLKLPRDRAIFDLPPMSVTAANSGSAKEPATDGDTEPA